DRNGAPDFLIHERFDLLETLALHGAVMSKVESQPLRRDERARLMDRLTKNLPERRMQQVRRRVIALGLPPPLARHTRRNAPETEGARERTDRGRPAVDLAHVVDLDMPTVADDLAPVGDLTARFRVEGRFPQEHGDPAVR